MRGKQRRPRPAADAHDDPALKEPDRITEHNGCGRPKTPTSVAEQRRMANEALRNAVPRVSTRERADGPPASLRAERPGSGNPSDRPYACFVGFFDSAGALPEAAGFLAGAFAGAAAMLGAALAGALLTVPLPAGFAAAAFAAGFFAAGFAAGFAAPLAGALAGFAAGAGAALGALFGSAFAGAGADLAAADLPAPALTPDVVLALAISISHRRKLSSANVAACYSHAEANTSVLRRKCFK
jgi:hypothetical protein